MIEDEKCKCFILTNKEIKEIQKNLTYIYIYIYIK